MAKMLFIQHPSGEHSGCFLPDTQLRSVSSEAEAKDHSAIAELPVRVFDTEESHFSGGIFEVLPFLLMVIRITIRTS